MSGRDTSSNPRDRHYDRPIAVLTGPGAVSSGDQVALRLSYHPSARTFGKSTAAAFNAPDFYTPYSGYFGATAFADCARVDAPDQLLTHLDFVIDEPVWLTPDDVAEGRDTVVEAAAQWIVDSSVGVEDDDSTAPDTPMVATQFLGAHPNPFNPTTELKISLAAPSQGTVEIFDLAGRRVRTYGLQGLAAGTHSLTFDGRDSRGVVLASGSYAVRVTTETLVDMGRVTLVK